MCRATQRIWVFARSMEYGNRKPRLIHHSRIRQVCTLTGLWCSSSEFGMTSRYQTSHSELLAANEANRFMCSVMRAHFRDLFNRKTNMRIELLWPAICGKFLWPNLQVCLWLHLHSGPGACEAAWIGPKEAEKVLRPKGQSSFVHFPIFRFSFAQLHWLLTSGQTESSLISFQQFNSID